VETTAHSILKQLALAFVREQGCMAAAAEVRCPISRYRVDVAGYRDVDLLLKRRCEPSCIVIECKQSRQDFFHHCKELAQLIHLREHLHRVRLSIEEHRIKREEPELRMSGTTLFAELDGWNYSASRLPSYRRVLRRLRRIDQQVYGETKFFLMARYCLADQLYIAAPRRMIRRAELPQGWGLLECPEYAFEHHASDALFSEPMKLHVQVEAPTLRARTDRRLRWLRNIAVAATIAARPRAMADKS
jgi:hypothetical protein